MKIRTPSGHKKIEDFQIDDEILSRNEYDPEGPIEVQRVEERFVRVAPIVELHVGGQVIRTTAEHPFWVKGKGWTATRHLTPTDLLACNDSKWVAVGEVHETSEFATVYNVRVSGDHTYFIGGDGRLPSVWSHNACVYQSNEEGTVRYVGIADTGSNPSLSRRMAAARARTPKANTDVVPGTDGSPVLQVQQAEQALIHYYGRQGVDPGGTLVNDYPGVNVSPRNTSAGYRLLSDINYWSNGSVFPLHSDGSGI